MSEAAEVWAVVVTFHPDEGVLENLAALRAEVRDVVVVDNGSSEAELGLLRAAKERVGFELLENGRNLGIATGLNIGMRHALARVREEGWVLLFDQDSCVTPGFTEAMLAGFRSSRWGGRLGLLVPAYRDRRLGSMLNPERAPGGGLEAAMTSGSLLRLSTVQEQGLFVDELFIDAVDQEYCLRLRRAGYRIDECPEAVLLHSPGEPTVHKFGGKARFQAANYSPVRRYYQERNKIWMYRRYFREFPRYCGRLLAGSLKDLLKIVLVEQGKGKKVGYFLHGVWDGMRERMGPYGVSK